MFSPARRARSRALLVLVSALALTAPLAPSAAQASVTDVGETQQISFRGATVTVPASWPVRRMTGRAGCVRFDRQAVYVGDPASITCPPHIVGRTQAVHLTTGSVAGITTPDRVVTADGSPVSVVVSAGEETAAARTIARSVSFDDAAADVVAPADLADARTFAGTSSVAATDSAQPRLADTTFTGQGFDACTARSLTELATWFQTSPYKAVNMYIGGASRGCSQPNLNASWVSGAIAQGWVLIPTYVGLQASCNDYPNEIDPAQASAQGIAAADDAVAQMSALGLGIGNPIYFDMEAFSYSNTTCRQGVLDFLDSWSAQLRYRGYVPGVYGSANSTIRAIVSQLSTPTFDLPDQLWIARWCPEPYSTSCYIGTDDPQVPADQWANHQRIRQYRGGHQETWGGVTINIDSNTVDAAVSPSSLAADGSFVSVTGRPELFRIVGGAPVYTSSWESVGLPAQPVQQLSQTQFDSLPDRPATGTFVAGGATGLIYRISGGIASYVPSWAPYGGPQPTTTVDQAALDNAGTGGVWNHLTSGKPSVRTTGPSGNGTTATRERFTYAGAISSSAIRNYDVRWRKARWDGGFDSWTRPASWQRTTADGVPLGLRAGRTYCVSVRARNRAGQLSGWSGGRCLSRALDDRRLSPSSGWTTRTGDSYYLDTYRATKRKGATLTRSGAVLKRVGIVATTCPRCGKVAVLVDGRRVGRINLESASTRRRQVLMLPAFTRERGTVTIRVRSTGLKVQIDGLVISRS
ncbi:MAG TPA: DUF1906 domain-containing protein [Actinomycetes bacterium]